MKPFVQAHNNGWALVLAPHGLRVFTDPKICPAKDFSCFFQPLSKCNYLEPQATHMLDFSDKLLKGLSWKIHSEKVIPERWRSKGYFWWISHNLGYIMRPSEYLKSEIRRHMKDLNWHSVHRDGPMIGMHVRHGDSCLKKEEKRMARFCDPVSKYMERAQDARELYGITRIYFATDSEVAIRDIELYRKGGRLGRTGWTIIYMDGVKRTGLKHKQEKLIWDEIIKDIDGGGKGGNLMSEALLSTIDMYLLSFTDVLIGKFTSNVLRIAMSLQMSRTHCVKPFISLDSPWCFDFGQKAGLGYKDQPFYC